MLMMRRKRLKQSCWRGSGRPNDCRVAQAQSFGDPQAGSLTQHQVGPFAARADGEKKDCCVPDGCTAPRKSMDTRRGSAIARPDQGREIVGVYFREPQATSEIYSNPPKAAEGEGEVLTITPAGNSGAIRVSNGGGS